MKDYPSCTMEQNQIREQNFARGLDFLDLFFIIHPAIINTIVHSAIAEHTICLNDLFKEINLLISFRHEIFYEYRAVLYW